MDPGLPLRGRRRREEPAATLRPLGEVLRKYVRRSGLATAVKHRRLHAAWSRVVPDPFRGLARLGGYQRRRVTVEVSSAAALHELSQFWRERLRRALIAELGGEYIEDLRFVLADTGSTHAEDEEG